MRAVYEELGALRCDAFSFDAIVNAREIRPYIPGKAVMGNVSTHAIGTMPEDKVRALTLNAREMGVDILAPACGPAALDAARQYPRYGRGGEMRRRAASVTSRRKEGIKA